MSPAANDDSHHDSDRARNVEQPPDRQEEARRAYGHSIVAGAPLSRSRLARQFGLSRAWARDRIREVHHGYDGYAEMKNGPADSRPPISTAEHRAVALPGGNTAHASAQRTNGRIVAWLAFIVGIAASVAANIMHAQVITTTSAAWLGAAFWPIALLLAVEVLTRVQWPTRSRWYTVARYGGTSLVAIVAAILSYRHMAGLLETWGEDSLSAHLGPLAVDGLMVTAAAALLSPGTTADREWRA